MRRLMLIPGITLLLAAGSALGQEGPPPEGQKPPEKLKSSGFDLQKFETQGFDPKQAATLEQISAARQSKISKLEQLLRDQPLYPEKAQVFFRLGEAYWEETKYQYLKGMNKYLAEAEAYENKTLATKPVQPKADYSTALEYYRKVIQQFPDYDRIDEVMYYLGRGALQQGKDNQDRNLQKEGVTYFQKLVQNYPRSRFLAEAYLNLGEYFFETDSLYYAKTNYEKIINNFPKSAMFNYALYKLGWVYFNLREFRKTVETFQKVVENVGQAAGQVSFRDQALDDLVKTYAEMEDSWREALDYFKSVLKEEDDIYRRMETLAGLYASYDKDKEAVELYDHFLDKFAASPKAPEWLDAELAIYRKINDFGKLEAHIRRILAYFDKDGRWQTANKGNAEAIEAGETLAEKNFAWLSAHWHEEAAKAEKARKQDVADDFYKRAASDYEIFLNRFPDSKQSYLISYNFAEILYGKVKDYEKALVQYQKCIERDKKGQFVEDAALGVIYSAYEIMCKQGIVECGEGQSGPRPVAMSKEKLREQQEKKIEETPLAEIEKSYIKGADQYVELLLNLRKDPEFVKKNPNRGERIPEVMFLAAQRFYSHGRFEDAVSRLQKIFDYDKSHKYAAVAAVTLVELYARLHRWEKAQEWAEALYKAKNFKFVTKGQLEDYIAIALSEHCNELSKLRRQSEAVACYDGLVKRFKDNKPMASKALMNMAVMFERAKDIKDAVLTYERVIKEYKNEEVAPEAQFVIGVIYESQTRFQEAAAAFMQMEKFKANKQAPDAIGNAGLIREAQKDYAGAIASFEKWLKLFPTNDRAPDVYFHIGQLYEKMGDRKSLDKAIKQYQTFTTKYGDKYVMKVEAYARAGDLLRREDEMDTAAQKPGKDGTKKRIFKNRSKATAMFTASLGEYAKAVQQVQTLAGEEKAAKGATANNYAAMASYWLADYVFQDFDSAKIPPTLQPNVLKNAIVTKADLHQKAEKAFDVVLTYKDKNWIGCAAFRNGLLYYNFAKELLEVPMPDGLSPDQEDQYRAILEQFATPIQEKALVLLKAAIETAHKEGVYNKCAKEAGVYATKVNPEGFPLSGEDQVTADKVKDTLLSANYIRTLRRGDKLVDMLKKIAPEAGGTK